jgi:hypothetical protein
MAWRNVYDQVPDSALRDSLQVGTNCVYVDALHELSPRFQDWPGLHHKFLQAAPGFLRLQSLSLELRLAEQVFSSCSSSESLSRVKSIAGPSSSP